MPCLCCSLDATSQNAYKTLRLESKTSLLLSSPPQQIATANLFSLQQSLRLCTMKFSLAIYLLACLVAIVAAVPAQPRLPKLGEVNRQFDPDCKCSIIQELLLGDKGNLQLTIETLESVSATSSRICFTSSSLLSLGLRNAHGGMEICCFPQYQHLPFCAGMHQH